MNRRFLVLGLALLLPGAVVGCGGDDAPGLSKVFLAAPWTVDETNEYNLARAEDGEIYGTCTLELRLAGEGGNTRINRLCGDGANRDDGTVLVEPGTLRPISANRTQFRAEKEERYSFSSTYEPPIVKFVADENGKPSETERQLPKPSDANPDPGYYDDESLLWLVRGIELREGYEGSFQNVSAGTGQTFRVDIRVEELESVRVPAGEFSAWRVRVRTNSVTQFFWVDAESPHILIKARIKGIQDVTYELVNSE